jgi:hypothetical protein
MDRLLHKQAHPNPSYGQVRKRINLVEDRYIEKREKLYIGFFYRVPPAFWRLPRTGDLAPYVPFSLSRPGVRTANAACGGNLDDVSFGGRKIDIFKRERKIMLGHESLRQDGCSGLP